MRYCRGSNRSGITNGIRRRHSRNNIDNFFENKLDMDLKNPIEQSMLLTWNGKYPPWKTRLRPSGN